MSVLIYFGRVAALSLAFLMTNDASCAFLCLERCVARMNRDLASMTFQSQYLCPPTSTTISSATHCPPDLGLYSSNASAARWE